MTTTKNYLCFAFQVDQSVYHDITARGSCQLRAESDDFMNINANSQ